MKQFLKHTFHITFFQLLVIGILCILKWIVNSIELPGNTAKLILSIAFISLLLILIIATGIAGSIENKHQSYADWAEKNKALGKYRLLIAFIGWAQAIPAFMFFALLIFTSVKPPLLFGLLLLSSIILRNAFDYFSKRHDAANSAAGTKKV